MLLSMFSQKKILPSLHLSTSFQCYEGLEIWPRLVELSQCHSCDYVTVNIKQFVYNIAAYSSIKMVYCKYQWKGNPTTWANKRYKIEKGNGEHFSNLNLLSLLPSLEAPVRKYSSGNLLFTMLYQVKNMTHWQLFFILFTGWFCHPPLFLCDTFFLPF